MNKPDITSLPLAFMVAGFIGCLAMAQCTKEQATQAITAGSGAAQIVCAVLLDPDKTERKICDTGAKLAELLGVLLSESSRPAPAPSAEAARAPAPSAASSTIAPTSMPEPQGRPKLLLLYVPDSVPADAGGGG